MAQQDIFPTIVAPLGEYKFGEWEKAVQDLTGIRNAAWTANVRGRLKTGPAEWQALTQGIREAINKLFFVVKARKARLLESVEKALSKMDDYARRETLSTTAMEFVKGNNAGSIVLAAQRAIAQRQLNLAYEYLYWGRMSGKISGNENQLRRRLFSQLSISDILDGLEEWEEFESEIILYQDMAVRDEFETKAGRWGHLLEEIGSLRGTDERTYNAILAKSMGTVSPYEPLGANVEETGNRKP